ncbi:MAG TPA: ABC transporter permease [Actinomycetota bacterium]|nr:ABC transporter permease [Actinomycetota bacterium]
MSVATSADAGARDLSVEIPPRRGNRRRWTSYILPTYSWLVIVYLLIPIAFMVLYSFNQSSSRLPQVNYKWEGFTTRWYQQWNGIPGLADAFFLSIKLALATTVVAAILGTLLALALVKYRFRGKAVTEQTLFTNIAAPEIVLGASLLGFFITLNLPLGFTTLLLAHVMFSIAYVTITVRARLSGYDMNVEWAAQDLGATPWVTFWKVTMPLIYPGIMAGALLAFALSIDDFVTSSFVAGNSTTFPLWVYAAIRVGIPPQVFVFGTVIFTVGVVVAAMNLVSQGRRKRRDEAARRKAEEAPEENVIDIESEFNVAVR